MKLKTKKGEVYVDGYIYENIQGLKEMIAAKFDGVFCVDGMEGSGKSELAYQWALIQTNFKLKEKDIIYTVEQFNDWIRTAKKGDVAVWDEFVLAGLSTDALTEMQNTLIKQFTIMRSKQLTVILVIPYIFMLRRYFAFSRTRFLLHTYAIGMKRGYCKFYDYGQKQWLYNYGQKTWFYNQKIKPAFNASFSVWSDKFLNHDLIAKRKQEALEYLEWEKKTLKLTKREIELLPQAITNPFKQKTQNANYIVINSFRQKLNKIKVM